MICSLSDKRTSISLLQTDNITVGKDMRGSAVVGIVGMCITGCFMELWVTLFAGCGKAAL